MIEMQYHECCPAALSATFEDTPAPLAIGGARRSLATSRVVDTGAVELRKELSTLTSLQLPATLIFDYPSVTEMTHALTAMLPAASPASAAAKPGQAAVAKAAGTSRGPTQDAAAAAGKSVASYWLPQVGFPSAA